MAGQQPNSQTATAIVLTCVWLLTYYFPGICQVPAGCMNVGIKLMIGRGFAPLYVCMISTYVCIVLAAIKVEKLVHVGCGFHSACSALDARSYATLHLAVLPSSLKAH